MRWTDADGVLAEDGLRVEQGARGTASREGDRLAWPLSPRAKGAGALAGVVLVAILLRIAAYQGFVGSDDAAYARFAHELARGTFALGAHRAIPAWALRLGVIAPTAGAIRLLGTSEWVFLAYPFLLSIASVFLAFVAGSRLFGRTAGLWAAAITAVLPLEVHFATELMADLASAFWANVAIVAIWSGRTATPRRAMAIGAGAGLSLGMSWLCKETVAYYAPFLVAWGFHALFRERRALWALGTAATAAVLVLGVELATYHVYAKDALFRLHELERNYTIDPAGLFVPALADAGWGTMLRHVLVTGPAFVAFHPQFALVVPVALFSAAYVGVRQKKLLFPAAWLISLLLVFEFGSTSLADYRPLALIPRYWYPLLLPSALLAGALVAALRRDGGDRIWRLERPLVLAVLAVFALRLAGGTVAELRAPVRSSVEARVSHVLGPSDCLYVDSRSAIVLDHFWRYPATANVVEFEGLRTREVEAGAFVLLNRERVDGLATYYRYEAPEFYSAVPTSWSSVWRAPDGKAVLYRVSGAAVTSCAKRTRLPHDPLPLGWTPLWKWSEAALWR